MQLQDLELQVRQLAALLRFKQEMLLG